ncbi:MAG TPA: twin-arginine translocation signal domain-containing protein [Anaerolineales bacterium]|nr:twin-arginine translocation signal domain-containing protein [Anaerolineales bacterium]
MTDQSTRASGLSRRDFLKAAGIGTGAMMLAACAPQRATSTPTARQPTAVPSPIPTVTYAGRKLCFVLWDHELARYDYKPRDLKNPVPETCPLYSGASNPVTPAWEAYWRGILRVCNPGMKDADFEQAWESLVASNRAFTNGTGPDTGNFAIHSLTCGGATHEMVTGTPYRGRMEIYTLNSKKAPPPIPGEPAQIDMTRHFFATTGSNVKLPDGSYAVYGFPQFENCIVPLVSPADTDMIDLSRISYVSKMQKPYHP